MKSKAEDKLLESSSNDSLSEDDEDGWMLTEEVEKKFYKTLSQIKNKDPNIYKKEVEFFKDVACPKKNESNSKKPTPLTLRDYERKLVLEKGGELSDEEPLQCSSSAENQQPTYVEEQENLKKSLKLVLNDASEDEDGESWGGLFTKREKSREEKEKEEKHYKEWLKGRKDCASDEEVEKVMQPLRDYWTDPNLNQEEQFLRDYVLNKKFLEHDKNEDLVNERVLLEENNKANSEDESEHKYKYRFEEPDQEFIKRYPRVMENSVRRKNDHRKQKRVEVKDRKLKEKEKKRAEIKHKKKLKKMEIEEKIEELKKLTGNDQLAFEDVLNQDFDIDEHDKAMQRLFNEEFYSQDDPNFQPADSAGYVEEPWNEDEYEETEVVESAEPLNCEDPNFNMDCDYDPTQDKPKPKDSRSKRRKDKHRRTTVSEAIKREKPTFDPTVHQSFKDYVDQYYAIDCEDFIGDLPCRFKYRRTVPNSYGLTTEEIFAADDKELDRWCSIKRIQQLRPEYKEKCDLKVYKKKAADENLKRKILPSLFKTEKDEGDSDNKVENDTPLENPNNKYYKKDHLEKTNEAPANQNDMSIEMKTRHKKKKTKQNSEIISKNRNKESFDRKSKKRKIEYMALDNSNCKKMCNNKNGKRSIQNNKKQINTPTSQETNLAGMSDARLLAYGIKPKKFRNKLKYKKKS